VSLEEVASENLLETAFCFFRGDSHKSKGASSFLLDFMGDDVSERTLY